MKKIIGIILCISMMFGFASMPADAAAKFSKSKDITTTVSLLETLGILKDYDIELIQAGKPVTRAMFCSVLVDFIGAGSETCDTLYYHDVPRDYWAFNSIGVLTQRGILTGTGEQYFNPEEPMEKNAAIRILANVIGLEMQAEMLGGYPTGYMKIANEVGLLDRCTSVTELSETDMLYMLENALTCPTGSFYVRAGELVRTVNEDETLLSKMYDMYIEKGVVTAAKGVSLNGNDKLDDKYTVIGGVKYESDIDMTDYLGAEVKFLYYSEDGSTDDAVIKLVLESDERNVLSIEIDPDCNYNEEANTITYYPDENRRKTAKLANGIFIIYNGSFYEGNATEILKGDRYSLKLVDIDGNSIYDTAIIWEYENIVVNSADSNKFIVYDKVDQKKNISLDEQDYDSCEIYANGVLKDFSVITKDSVLSVYMSKDKKRVKVYISDTVLKGELRGIDTEEKIITVGDNEYTLKKDLNTSYKIGDPVSVYLDVYGFVADIRVSSTIVRPGYILRLRYNEDEDVSKINVLTTDNAIAELELSKKVKIDGAVCKTWDKVEAALADGGELVPQIIMYQLDDNNVVKYIDTIKHGEGEDESTLVQTNASLLRTYRSAGKKFGLKFCLDANTVIFAIPNGITSKNFRDYDLMTKKCTDLMGDTNYTCESYRATSEDIAPEQYVVIKGYDWNAPNYATLSVLVDKIIKTINDDGEVVDCIIGYQGRNEVEFLCDAMYKPLDKGIKRGDLIRATLNTAGNVTNCDVSFSYGSAEDKWPVSTTYERFRTISGYVNDKVGDYLKVGFKSYMDYDEILNVGTAPVLIFDSSDGKDCIRVGSVDDIVSFQMGGRNADFVVVQDSYFQPRLIVVYR